MDNNDIIIALVDHIKSSGRSQTVKFEDADSTLGFPEGTTAQHIDAAAAQAGYEVDLLGSDSIRLVKLPTRIKRS